MGWDAGQPPPANRPLSLPFWLLAALPKDGPLSKPPPRKMYDGLYTQMCPGKTSLLHSFVLFSVRSKLLLNHIHTLPMKPVLWNTFRVDGQVLSPLSSSLSSPGEWSATRGPAGGLG